MSNIDTEILNVEAIRADFPILSTKIRKKYPLVYLDNGATTQKPTSVIDRINLYYKEHNSNIHRGVHYLSDFSTNEYEAARKKIQKFINAPSSDEVIFTKGTTDGINLVAHCLGREFLKEGDEVIISHMEHHSNIVPWQMICEATGATLEVVDINDKGELDMKHFKSLLSHNTQLVSITHVSNTLGTINPVKEIIELAHEADAKVLVDGAQAIQHMKVDVQDLDADFYVFSGHKMFGPTGIGILYGKKEWLDHMPPYQGGGDMIKTVSFAKTTFNVIPHKFEAGTPNIAGGTALGTAVDYINKIGIENIEAYEAELLAYATEKMKAIEGLKIIGTAANKSGVISFIIHGVHPFDLGTLLDTKGIAIRTGHHCTQPIMDRFNISGTARASFSFYNTKEEVDFLVQEIKNALKVLL